MEKIIFEMGIGYLGLVYCILFILVVKIKFS